MSSPGLLEDEGIRTFDFRAWRELFGRVLRYRREVRGLVAAAILTSAVDASFPLVTRAVIDRVVRDGAQASLLGPALAYLALALMLSGCIVVFIRLAGKLATCVAHDVREEAFAQLQLQSFAFYDRRPAGWLLARMTSDCDRLARILAWGLLDATWGLTLMGAITVVLFVLSWKLALVALAVLPLLLAVSLVFQRKLLVSARRVRKAGSRITAACAEDLMAARTTKSLAREEDSQREFQALTNEMHAAAVKNALQSALYLPLVMTLGSVGAGLVIAQGTGLVGAGALSLGTLVAFITFTLRFFDPVHELAATFANLQMAQAAAERVLALIHAEPQVKDDPGALVTPPARADRLELRGVSFGYGSETEVLHGIDLAIEPGTTVALVGPTGGGKTTLAALACRFYEPTAGEVLVNGVDYRRLPLAWWRSQVAVVLQQPFLFTGTIRENVRYGRLDATDGEVEEAARLAGALDVIGALPNGWDTPVGERGARLSTGQAQLVSIARALLADAALLVLDEATSSVDAETERLVQRGLARAMEGRTSLVIAHRLSTIQNADQIVVVDGGRITARGRHGELLAREGLYRELVLEQGLQSLRTAW